MNPSQSFSPNSNALTNANANANLGSRTLGGQSNQPNTFSPNQNALTNANANAGLATKTLGMPIIHPAVQGMIDSYNSLPPEHIAQLGVMHPDIQRAFNKLQAPPIPPPVPPTPNLSPRPYQIQGLNNLQSNG